MADDAALLKALQQRLHSTTGPLPKLEYVAAALAMARDQIAPVFALAKVPRGGSRTRVLQWRDRIVREHLLVACTPPPLPAAPLCRVCQLECQLVVAPAQPRMPCTMCSAALVPGALYWGCASNNLGIASQCSRAEPGGELRTFYYRDCVDDPRDDDRSWSRNWLCKSRCGVNAYAEAIQFCNTEEHEYNLCHSCSGTAIVDWGNTELTTCQRLIPFGDSEDESDDESDLTIKNEYFNGCLCDDSDKKLAACNGFWADLPCVQREIERVQIEWQLQPELLVSEDWIRENCPNIRWLWVYTLALAPDGSKHALRIVDAYLRPGGQSAPLDGTRAQWVCEDGTVEYYADGIIKYDLPTDAPEEHTEQQRQRRNDRHRRREEEILRRLNAGVLIADPARAPKWGTLS